jgi:sec-independent protein translocase protein TatC
MSVVDHLEELRFRIIVSVAAVGVGTIIGWVLHRQILDVLRIPLDQSNKIGGIPVDDLYVTGVATGFILTMKIAVFAGFLFALPVTLFQLWRFITPGLRAREKRYAIPFVLSAIVLFAIGAYVAFLLLPVGIKWLLAYVPPAQPLIHLTEYLNFVILMVLAFGISFEFPLVLVFLAGAGLMSSRALATRRRFALVMAFIVAAIATPSGDPISCTALAVPLYILYEISILVIRFGLKR